MAPAASSDASPVTGCCATARPVIQQGRLYRIASVRDAPIGASQYLAPDGARIVVLAWWGPHVWLSRL